MMEETEAHGNIAITVKDVHVSYRVLKTSSIRSIWNRLGQKSRVFEAVRGVSFEIEEGKILGIIGPNGAGKSTLLRTVAGIFSPDSGSIDLHGHSISLLSIGVGFNKKLSGIENIYLSGMLLGFSEAEIAAKEKEIIAFADIGNAINEPVKTYSSGMHSKLAFAITAILETDIMLIDEVLSVGDAKFSKKSYDKMKELISNDKRTVIIVSHSLGTIKNLCDEAILLNEGKIVARGETEKVIAEYEALISL